MGGSKATIPLVVLALAFGVTLALYLWPALGPQVAGISSAPPNAAPPSAPLPSAPLPSATAPSAGQTSGGSPSAAPSPPAPPAPAAQAPVVPPEPQTAASAPPQFDVVRVEPSGEAVIAGKGAPNAKVEALASGKVVGEAMADGSGQFVILPPPFPPGDYDLTLRQTVEGKAAESTQSVAVAVPTKGGAVVVALAEPGKPTRLLGAPPKVQVQASETPASETPALATKAPPAPAKSAPAAADVANAPPDAATPAAAPAPPPTPIAPAPAAPPALVIRSVELENGNGFFVSGTAAPDTHLQIYLNASHLADVVAGPDGQWSVTIKQGLTPGHYAVRADAGGAAGAVTARAEVPFDVPVAMAQATTPAPAPEATPPTTPLPRPDIAAAAPPQAKAAPAPTPSSPVAPSSSSAPSPAPPSPAPVEAVPPPTANAVIEQVETAVVVRGDNLWNISRARLGHGRRFTQIYDANASQIRDPRLIYPGQVFVMPKK